MLVFVLWTFLVLFITREIVIVLNVSMHVWITKRFVSSKEFSKNIGWSPSGPGAFKCLKEFIALWISYIDRGKFKISCSSYVRLFTTSEIIVKG